MARKTIKELEFIIDEDSKTISELLSALQLLRKELNDIKNNNGVVKQEEYDFLVRKNKTLEIENNMLKNKIKKLDINVFKKEIEELKEMVKELQKELSNRSKSGRKQKLDDADKFLIKFEYGSGSSMDYLAKKFNVSKGTIFNVIHSK